MTVIVRGRRVVTCVIWFEKPNYSTVLLVSFDACTASSKTVTVWLAPAASEPLEGDMEKGAGATPLHASDAVLLLDRV